MSRSTGGNEHRSFPVSRRSFLGRSAGAAAGAAAVGGLARMVHAAGEETLGMLGPRPCRQTVRTRAPCRG